MLNLRATHRVARWAHASKSLARIASIVAGENFLASEGGDDMGDSVIEGRLAIEVGLPESFEKLEVIVPAALIESFTERVGSVLALPGVSAFRVDHGLYDFAGGVKDERVPQVARNRFVALAAFSIDGQLHGLGDAVGGLVEQNLERGVALIAGIGAGDDDTQGIERGVSAGIVREGGDIDADALLRPAGLVNLGQALR